LTVTYKDAAPTELASILAKRGLFLAWREDLPRTRNLRNFTPETFGAV